MHCLVLALVRPLRASGFGGEVLVEGLVALCGAQLAVVSLVSGDQDLLVAVFDQGQPGRVPRQG